MRQCLYMQPDGKRCPQPAETDYPFCRWHLRVMLEEEDPGRRRRRALLRLAALVALVAFLLPLAVQGYRLLKAMLN